MSLVTGSALTEAVWIAQNAPMTDEASTSEATAGTGTRPDGPPVAGTVRLLTDEQVEIPKDGSLAGLGQELSRIVNRRPWLVPAVLLGVATAYLLVRRRR